MNSYMRHVFAVTVFLLVAIAGLTSYCSAEDAVASTYTSRCANCHSANGSGKTPAGAKMSIPDLRSKEIQSMSDSQLYETIAKGAKHKNYPHAYLYTGLNENQIHGLVAYIRKLK
ncbi:MAG: cytochrome c [Terriglobales bacterium]